MTLSTLRHIENHNGRLQSALDTYLELWRAVDWARLSSRAGQPVELAWASNRDAVEMVHELRTASCGWANEACDLPHDLTLLHGDFHKGNIMSKYLHSETNCNNVELCIVDWQNYGLGHPVRAMSLIGLLCAQSSQCILVCHFVTSLIF